MNRKAIVSAALSLALCAGMSLQAHAVYDPMKVMEERSRQAVAAAIKEGTIPPDSTIYDCAYGKGADGVTRVVQYKDENGQWIDVATGEKKDYLPGTFTEKVPEETLMEYMDELFRLTNAEREKEGLEPLERDSLLDEAAMMRAPEVVIVDRADGEAHTRPDGTSYKDLVDDLGGNGRRCGENIARAESSPQSAIEAWMRSDGHRDNILRDDYGSIGIGVYQLPDGSLDWIQIFMLK